MSLRAAAGRRKKKKKTTDSGRTELKSLQWWEKKKKTFRRLPATGSVSGPNQGPGVRRGAGSGDWLMEGRSEGIWWTGGE